MLRRRPAVVAALESAAAPRLDPKTARDLKALDAAMKTPKDAKK